jgi:hypothetical protein
MNEQDYEDEPLETLEDTYHKVLDAIRLMTPEEKAETRKAIYRQMGATESQIEQWEKDAK